MTKQKTKKQGFSIYWLFGKIGDILFIPIILIALFSSTSMLIQKRQNKPTSFFGFSIVNILSRSMTDQGFLKGDTVITKNAGVDSIELGDVIAFYNYRDSIDKNTIKNIVIKYDVVGEERQSDFKVLFDADPITGISIDSVSKVDRKNAKTVEDAQNSKSPVYFHQVVGIYVDNYGNVFYQTKGSNNNYLDDYIRSDFVVGEYVNTPRFFRDTMSFCASAQGMIILVCLPLSILVLMQCFSLIKQIETMNMEKQLITGKKHFTDEEVSKVLNGNEMETYNKVLLYYLSEPEERSNIKEYMWSDILNNEKLSKSDKKLLDTLNDANQGLSESNDAYWQIWIDNTKGHTRKKLKQYYEDISVTSVLETNKKSSEKIVDMPKKQEDIFSVENEDITKALISKVVASNETSKQQATQKTAQNLAKGNKLATTTLNVVKENNIAKKQEVKPKTIKQPAKASVKKESVATSNSKIKKAMAKTDGIKNDIKTATVSTTQKKTAKPIPKK